MKNKRKPKDFSIVYYSYIAALFYNESFGGKSSLQSCLSAMTHYCLGSLLILGVSGLIHFPFKKTFEIKLHSFFIDAIKNRQIYESKNSGDSESIFTELNDVTVVEFWSKISIGDKTSRVGTACVCSHI